MEQWSDEYQSWLPSTAATATEAAAAAAEAAYFLFTSVLLHLGSLQIYFAALPKALIWGVCQGHPTSLSHSTPEPPAAVGEGISGSAGGYPSWPFGGDSSKKNIKDSRPVKTDAVTCSELCGHVLRVSSLRASICPCPS